MAGFDFSGGTFGNGNDDILKILMNRNKQMQSQGDPTQNQNNQNMSASAINPMSAFSGAASNSGSTSEGSSSGGGAAGLLGKINPLTAGLNAAQSITDTVNAAMKPHFDFGQDNYTVAQAGQAEGDRASGIAKAATSGIPLVGGVLGGIFGAIANAIAKKRGEAHAQMILGNRQEHMNNLQDYQMEKIQNNNFLKSSDLYKNMLNNQQEQNQNY